MQADPAAETGNATDTNAPALDVLTIPCLKDNYAYLVHDPARGATSLVDVPEAAPILQALREHGWTLDQILITHHHDDHVAGLAEVLAVHKASVLGAQADAHRLPPLDQALREGDMVRIGSAEGTVIDVSGHTVGHIAFHFPAAKLLFTADSLMALGCGRVFEGSHAQMWESLSKLAGLPRDTLVCSGHEYTAANARFAITVDPGNAALRRRIGDIETARAAGVPTVPSQLGLELDTNPFLRATDPDIAAHLGLTGAPPVEVFSAIRSAKDAF